MSRFVAPRPRQAHFTLPASKPRNPLVAASRMRQAGGHSNGNERQQASRDLRKQIAESGDRSP